jgi:hypothetical protein
VLRQSGLFRQVIKVAAISEQFRERRSFVYRIEAGPLDVPGNGNAAAARIV